MRIHNIVFLILPMLLWNCKRQDVAATTKSPLPPIGVELCRSPGFSIIRLDSKSLPKVRYGDENGAKVRQFVAEPLKSIVCYVWSTTVARTEWRTPLPSGYFNMTVPGANDSRYTKESAFGQALEEAFHVKIFAIEEEKPVTVLKWLGSGLPAGIKRSNPGEDKSKAVNYSIAEFKAYGINEFADWIESQWEQMPVIDETNLNDTYDFSLKCNTIMQPESIPKNVQELGIEVRTEKRKLRVVIVEPS